MVNDIFEKVIRSECQEFLYAHRSNNDFETLSEHAQTCLDIFSHIKGNTLERISLELDVDKTIITYIFESALIMHDIGKSTSYYQFNKMGIGEPPKNNIIKFSNHSQLSAVYYFDQMFEYINDNVKEKHQEYLLVTCILMECIAKHHSKLNNIENFSVEFDDYLVELSHNLDNTEIFAYFKYIPNFLNTKHKHFFNHNIHQLLNVTSVKFREQLYSCGLIFFSLLTTTDILATKYFAQKFVFESDLYDNGLKRFLSLSYNQSEWNQSIISYRKDSSFEVLTLNDIRSEFILDLDNHLNQINNEDQLFYLEGVVGIGKTHASQRFAIEMVRRGATRIFWCVPYLSIASQINNANIKLDNQTVQLDSMTPIRTEYTGYKADYTKMVVNDQLMNYRNATFTFVRFFNLLFSNSKVNALKRLSLRDSVIIIDELQSVNILLMNQLIVQIEKMAKLLNFKLLFMSATLPKLERCIALSNSDRFRKESILINRNQLNFDFYSSADSHLAVLEKIETKNNRILIQCVTKKMANQLYEQIVKSYSHVWLFTGDTSREERKKIINCVNEKEVDGQYRYKELILVTTNAIEAGVDISLNLAIVSLTTLDSLEQLSGRINRNQEFDPEESVIYILNFENPHFLSPIKTNYTRALGVEKMNNIFRAKNYNLFMTEVLNLAREDKSYKGQTDSTQELKYTDMSNLMRLITNESCYYYHVKDKFSNDLMACYLELTDKLKIDNTHFDEYYIKRKNIIRQLQSYRHEIREQKMIAKFLEVYPDTSIVFYPYPTTFEEDYPIVEGKL